MEEEDDDDNEHGPDGGLFGGRLVCDREVRPGRSSSSTGARRGCGFAGPVPSQKLTAITCADNAHDERTEALRMYDSIVSFLGVVDDPFPLLPLPMPPRPGSRSSRIRSRHFLAMRLWAAAERVRAGLNRLYETTQPFCGMRGLTTTIADTV